MAVPKSTSTPRRKQGGSPHGTPPASPTVGRSPLSTRPPISSPSSQRFPVEQQGVPSSPGSPYTDDREAGRRRWEEEQRRKADEARRIEDVKLQLEQGRREREEFGNMGQGRGGDQPRENTYDSYFPEQKTPPRQQHQPQPSDSNDGGFASMLSATPDSDSEDDDYHPSSVNATTGMRLPAPLPSAHSSPGRSSPSRNHFPVPEPKRSLSPPPVGSLEPKSPPPSKAGGAGPARERVEYQPMSEKERRQSARPHQPSSSGQAQSGSFTQNRQQHSQHQQQPLLHHDPSNPFANPPSQEIQARHPPGQLNIDTRNLSYASSASSPFQGGSPFNGALPSPALAWAPNEKLSPSENATARMEERVLIRGRDRGEDRSTKFWNRFSMVAHDSNKRLSRDAAWLKKEALRTKRQKIWAWLAFFLIIAGIGGGLAAYFLTKDANAATVSGNFQTATVGPGVNIAETSTTTKASSSTTTKKASSAAASATGLTKRVVPQSEEVERRAADQAWENRLGHLLANGGAPSLPEIRAASLPRSTDKRRLASSSSHEDLA
ncbi:hypothetical protein BDY24DRAFT_411075 [Mrakia frigida]|uniref:uncharacterized protein n=1 Tax=Mrakia frigida TaxID=29902 RepID=UPI003FCBF628